MGGRLTAGPQSYFSNLTCLSSQKEHRPDVPLLLLYCFPTFAQIGRRPKDPAIPAPGTVGKPGSAILLGSGLSARFAGKQQRPLCTFQGEQPVLQWQAAAKARGLPLLPITRWQGTMMGIGFAPFARPTARAARGAPISRASCP